MNVMFDFKYMYSYNMIKNSTVSTYIILSLTSIYPWEASLVKIMENTIRRKLLHDCIFVCVLLMLKIISIYIYMLFTKQYLLIQPVVVATCYTSQFI